MDLIRQRDRMRRRIRATAIVLVFLAIVLGISLGLSHLASATPRVDRRELHIDQVQRGTLIHDIRGVGTLVAEDVLWISAETEASVTQILALPGTELTAEAQILQLQNPDLEHQALAARSDLNAAEALLESTKAELQKELLAMEAALVKLDAESEVADFEAEIDEGLFEQAVVTENALRLKQLKAESLRSQIKVERRRLEIFRESLPDQYAYQESQVAKAAEILKEIERDVRSLNVLAGVDGVLEEVAVEVGQRVNPGDVLAKVINPRRLKALLKVPEVQASYLQHGLPAVVDTHHGVVTGSVSRIEPSVQEGGVFVDVTFNEELPRNARPDLSVIGTIEIQRLDDVLHVGRPVFGLANSTIEVFKFSESDGIAIRCPVTIGVASVSSVEVKEGLQEGDHVILTDMSEWESVDLIEID